MGKRMIILSIRFIPSKSQQLARQSLRTLSNSLIYRIAEMSLNTKHRADRTDRRIMKLTLAQVGDIISL